MPVSERLIVVVGVEDLVAVAAADCERDTVADTDPEVERDARALLEVLTDPVTETDTDRLLEDVTVTVELCVLVPFTVGLCDSFWVRVWLTDPVEDGVDRREGVALEVYEVERVTGGVLERDGSLVDRAVTERLRWAVFVTVWDREAADVGVDDCEAACD